MNNMSAPQWRPFLSLLSQELTHTLAPGLLRHLMRSTGEQFAGQYGLAPARTVGDMQDAMNQIWAELGWGSVEIYEADNRLVLTHRNAPIAAAFGRENQAWAAALLEGTYEAWMYQLGADSRLHVSSGGPADVSGTMIFFFGKS